MMVYGEGGVGKSTFASTADRPLMLDFENGSKYFGNRGISLDVINISSWSQVEEFRVALKKGVSKYDTIVIDPIGEVMDKLKQSIINRGEKKFVQQYDNSLTIAGWGEMKSQFKVFMKELRDSGKNVILIGHVEEKDDEGTLVKRPMIETKVATDVRNLVDIVGYMYTGKDAEGKEGRVICVQDNPRFWAKDRTGVLGKFIPADFKFISKKLDSFSWKKEETKPETEAVDTVDTDEVGHTETETTVPSKQVADTKTEATELLGDALKKPSPKMSAKDLEKLQCEIKDLEEEIEYEENNYKVALEHPTKTATFARGLEKAHAKIEEKKTTLAGLKEQLK